MPSPTDTAHPVLDFGGRQRISRTACVSANQYDQSDGLALASALLKVRESVEKKSAGLEVGGRFYYVTYEVVVDGDGGDGTGRPMRPPVDGAAAGVVLGGVQQRVAA